ncbi:hypothetical protein UlMin_010485 [Ulmus minor]
MHVLLSFKDAELKNTGLERSESFSKDLEWFKEQGYAIPEPSAPAVAKKILNSKGLDFYKWDGDISQLLQNTWTREENNHCLEETKKSFKYSRDILR